MGSEIDHREDGASGSSDVSNAFSDVSNIFSDASNTFSDVSNTFSDVSNTFSNVSNTFSDVLHGVFVSVGVGIEGSEVLDQLEASMLLLFSVDRAVEFSVCGLNDAKLHPLGHMFLHLSFVGIWDFELFNNWFFCCEGDLVQEHVSLP